MFLSLEVVVLAVVQFDIKESAMMYGKKLIMRQEHRIPMGSFLSALLLD